jgi:hypothetical protein
MTSGTGACGGGIEIGRWAINFWKLRGFGCLE